MSLSSKLSSSFSSTLSCKTSRKSAMSPGSDRVSFSKLSVNLV